MSSKESKKKKNDLEERLTRFAISIIGVVESLPDTRTGSHLGGQLLRSGTSPALNYGEAQAAESKRDFIHKLQVILKELRESAITLRILRSRSLLADPSPLNESQELVAIFVASINTAKRNDGRWSHTA